MLTLGTCDTAGPIEIESSGGTTAPTAYTTLKAGFDAINAGIHTGTVNIEVCGNTTETATAEILASGVGASSYTSVTIRPVGSARTIEGTNATALVKLTGADNVTFDGSLSGGTDRSLTFSNPGTGAIIWIATNSTDGANNNTIKNSVAVGPGGFAGQGIIAGSGTTLGNPAEFPNSNNTIRNNAIRAVQNAAFINGNATTSDQNWSITDNEAGSATDTEKLSFRGFLISNSSNFTISRNRISGVSSSTTTTATMSGIQVSGNINGGMITRNEIKDIRQNNSVGWGANGIFSTASTTASNLTIANNFISDVRGNGFNGVTSSDNGYGIMINSGGGFNIYFNTINMNTNQTASGSITAAVNIAAAVTTAGGIDLRTIF